MRSHNYLEQYSVPDSDGIDNVTVSEAFTACKVHELELIETLLEKGELTIQNSEFWMVRKNQLEKELRNIKIK
jgi:hypothetical protein